MRRWLAFALTATMVVAMATVAMADDEVPEFDDTVEDRGELADKQLQRARSLATYFSAILPVAPIPEDAPDDATGEPSVSCLVENAEEAGTVDDAASALCEVLVELRTGDERVGWGAMYKLLLLSQAKDVSLSELLAEFSESDEGWGFGKAFKELREGDDPDWRGDTPKNLGQFKKQERDTKSPHERGPKKKDR